MNTDVVLTGMSPDDLTDKDKEQVNAAVVHGSKLKEMEESDIDKLLEDHE